MDDDNEGEVLRTFARGISHNFNNLLTAGMGFLSLAMESVSDRDLLALLRNVELCHQRIGHLSKQLLAFTGDEAPCVQLLHLHDSLQNALNLFDAIAMHQRTVLLCDFSKLNGVMIRADEFKLVQALLQMLNNAAESIDKTGRIDFHGYAENDKAIIEIKDNGRGMSQENAKRAFSPFYTTKQIVGVGLGLSAAHTIIESFGGTLELESELGKGTTARITLPISSETCDDTFEQELPSLREGLSVLLAVDAPQTRDMLQAVLMSFAFHVELADCRETLHEKLLASRVKYDVIIADLLNGDFFGDELLEYLRRHTSSPIITLYTSRNELPAENYEDIHYLQKPFDPPQLLTALQSFDSLKT